MRNSGERLIRLAEAASILACGHKEARRTLEAWGVVPARMGYRGCACTAWRLADVEDVVVRMSLAAKEAVAASAKRRVRARNFTAPRTFDEFAELFGPCRSAVQ